jgi:hypothetical protein
MGINQNILLETIEQLEINEIIVNENELRLYHFYPNDWGEEYYLIAHSKLKAHGFLLAHLENKIKTDESYRCEYDKWKEVDPYNPLSFPDKFTLNVYKIGEVIESEIA